MPAGDGGGSRHADANELVPRPAERAREPDAIARGGPATSNRARAAQAARARAARGEEEIEPEELVREFTASAAPPLPAPPEPGARVEHDRAAPTGSAIGAAPDIPPLPAPPEPLSPIGSKPWR